MNTSDLATALSDFFHARWPSDGTASEPGDLADSPWPEFRALGLHLIDVAEEAGGSGGSFADLMAVATLTGRHAAAIPAMESATAAWALTLASLPVDPGATYSVAIDASSVTIADDGTANGTVTGVPWGRSADRVVAIADDGRTIAFAPEHATIRHDHDLAGQPRDAFTLRATPVAAAPGATPEALRLRLAALRVAQLAGVLHATAELTRRYVGERVQFGKPIGSFQAVQAHVVELQQMAVMTTSLADRLATAPELDALAVTGAALVAAENAVTAAAAAHQAHGAIGMTREYRLHLFTRRLHAWSGDAGEPLELSARLGAWATAAPSFARLILDDRKTEAQP